MSGLGGCRRLVTALSTDVGPGARLWHCADPPVSLLLSCRWQVHLLPQPRVSELAQSIASAHTGSSATHRTPPLAHRHASTGMSAPAASAAAAAGSTGQRYLAPPAGAPAAPMEAGAWSRMTKLLSDVPARCIDYHPTLPLLLTDSYDIKMTVFNWQTNAIVGEVQLKPKSAKHPYVSACRWLRPTADQPTVNQFLAILSAGEIFVCTVKSIEAAAVSTIEARRLQATVQGVACIAINSSNSLVCAGLVLVDLHSGRELLNIDHGILSAVQFAEENPYTLLAYEQEGCCKYDLRSSACRGGRVSLARPPKEWIASPKALKSNLLFPLQKNTASVTFSPDARSIALIQEDGAVCVRSTEADGRVLFEVPREQGSVVCHDYAFTPDGSHLLTWHSQDGVVRLLSMADGSVRWSIQLPNWNDGMKLISIRSCPDQLDRFVCVIWNHRKEFEYILFDGQVQQAVQPRLSAPVAPAAAAAAAAAAASSAAPSVPSATPSTLISPLPSALACVSTCPLQSQVLHLQMKLQMEQLKARHAAEQLELAQKIIGRMEQATAAAGTAAPSIAAAASLPPGQIVVKREAVLDLHEKASVAQRQKRKAEEETKEEREEHHRQATRHREEVERRWTEQRRLQAELDGQREQLENERMKTTCCVCLSAAVEVVYTPCGHAACCSECDRSLQHTAVQSGRQAACPICQQAIQGQTRVTSMQR